jgi:hypothetical protein
VAGAVEAILMERKTRWYYRIISLSLKQKKPGQGFSIVKGRVGLDGAKPIRPVKGSPFCLRQVTLWLAKKSFG